MTRRAIGAALLLVLGFTLPAAGQEGPWYDVSCPTGPAQVVLDPGHGGDDPGAVQETYGLYERVLAMEVTDRTAELLRDSGYTVALTREDGDAELANSQRGEIANACGAAVFVEIHLNASLDTTMDYTQVFWAEKEKDLAFSLVMRDALTAIGIPVADVDRFDNGGLIRAKMPGVLVETVFLTNGEEAKDLANGTRQESIARAIASGVDGWLSLTDSAGEDRPATPEAASAVASTPAASPVAATPGATPVAAPLAFAPGAEIEGASLQAWMSRRWQWLLSLPIGGNPGQDASGERCGVGQEGPVFFLPSNLPPCTVPAGAAVLVPVAGAICTTADPMAVGDDERDLRSCADEDAGRYTALRVFVDGAEVPAIGTYRVTTDRFALDLPEHNILGVPAGRAEAVASGYQVILPPLPPGEHELIVHVELADGTVLPDKRTVLTVAGS